MVNLTNCSATEQKPCLYKAKTVFVFYANYFIRTNVLLFTLHILNNVFALIIFNWLFHFLCKFSRAIIVSKFAMPFIN